MPSDKSQTLLQPAILSHVPGRARLHCPVGVRPYEAHLRSVDGVLQVQANPITDTILVHYDPQRTDLDQLLKVRRRMARKLPLHKILRKLGWVDAVVGFQWTAILELFLSTPRARRWLRRRVGRRASNVLAFLQAAAGLLLADSWLGLALGAFEIGRFLQRTLRSIRTRPAAIPAGAPLPGHLVALSPQAFLATGPVYRLAAQVG